MMWEAEFAKNKESSFLSLDNLLCFDSHQRPSSFSGHYHKKSYLEGNIEKEYEGRIAAINAVVAVCDAEEGAPSQPRAPQKRSADAADMPRAIPIPQRQKSIPSDVSGDPFSEAIASVCIKCLEERPTICFICLGNPRLPERERLREYKTWLPRSTFRQLPYQAIPK